MIRILFYIVIILALGWGFSWLADRPGELTLVWQGQMIEMSVMVAASLFVAALACILFVWWLVRTIWTSPQSMTRYFRARKRDRGYQALSTGLIAAGAGNAAVARKMSDRAKSLLRVDQEPLIQLLDAQTSLIEGRHQDARKTFELMAEDPETKELGLRGLYLEARRLGEDEAARQFAEKAAQSSPQLVWAAEATLEDKVRSGLFDDAIRILEQSRLVGTIDKKEADRKKAVLLTARAAAKLESDPKGARDDALYAIRLADNLVPAAVIAAKALFREGSVRKGLAVLEQMWFHEQHPDIARAYVKAAGGDSVVDRMKRAERLESLKPNNAQALSTAARVALDARDFVVARQKAEAAARMVPSESAFLLLTDIEEADTGDQGRMRHWLAQAMRAPRDAAWVADGKVSKSWLPISPVSGRLDAFEWKVPERELAGPFEEGRVMDVEEAFLSLPPVAMRITESASEQFVADPPPVAQSEKPVVTEAKVERKAKTELPQPFFGGAPDDPGVKSGATGPGSRLKLF